MASQKLKSKVSAVLKSWKLRKNQIRELHKYKQKVLLSQRKEPYVLQGEGTPTIFLTMTGAMLRKNQKMLQRQ